MITGSNGSGKTSIRMAAEYAVHGKVKGLQKAQLVKENSSTPLKVVLECLRADGELLRITRSGNRTTLTGKDMDGVSVRESNIMAQLELSMQYSFLSQDVAAFTDMREHQRKEMLDDLIPEVILLRGTCVPWLKNVNREYTHRLFSIDSNIAQFQAIHEEIRINISRAWAQMESERARREMILQAQAQNMPHTEAQQEALLEEISATNEKIKAISKYLSDLAAWIDYADVLLRQGSQAQGRMAVLENERRGWLRQAEELVVLLRQAQSEACPHCKVELHCRNCGGQITNTDRMAEVQKMHDSAALKVAQTERAIHDLNIELEKDQAPDSEKVHEARINARNAQNTLNGLRERMNELQQATARYDAAVRNIEEAHKLIMSDTLMQSMAQNISDFQAREEEIRTKIERKSRTRKIGEATSVRIGRAVDTMYTTLPAVYFDRLLTKLTTACNYLLAQVSDKTIQMSADEKNIFLRVSGKEFAQLSSGERQRVRIAVTLAFSLLAVSSDTLFLDEVFDSALDEEGVWVLGKLISETMIRWYPKIVVVTHNKDLAAAINPHRVVMVTKENNASKMEIENVRQ